MQKPSPSRLQPWTRASPSQEIKTMTSNSSCSVQTSAKSQNRIPRSTQHPHSDSPVPSGSPCSLTAKQPTSPHRATGPIQGLMEESSPSAAAYPVRASPPSDPYHSVNRSLKYALLFLGLVFLSYFIFEVTTGKRIHAAQYILIGIAQIIFYLLLLSFAERIGFDYGFLIAGAATVLLLSANAGWIFASRLQALRAFVIFTLLYTLIYLLLRLEDNSLLVGAIASFLAVAAAMYFTRSIDWYSSFPAPNGPEPPPMPLSPKVAE